LRTPLSVIRGIGELGLAETRTPAEYKESIGSMLEEVGRLTHLVDTLLRLARGDAGTVHLAPDVIDLGELAQGVAASLTVLAEERRQRVQVRVAGHIPVLADRLVLREALTNVVDNAIKYGEMGSTIAVDVDGDHRDATVSVLDQGPGIAPEHRARIFDRFYRIDEGRSRESGGTGLGLAIAKWAVEASGGQITLESAGRGSLFRIRLPRHQTATAVTIETATPIQNDQK
jgi:signal transduction histidine kinase